MGDARFLGYESIIDDLSTLISVYPPPFFFINDPTSPRLSASVINTLFQNLSTSRPNSDQGVSSKQLYYARVNGVACFTPRLFYDSVLNALAGWTPNWDDGCKNWSSEGDQESERWNENFDTFLHGLKAVFRYLQDKETDAARQKKRKQKEYAGERDGVRLVIFVERAEKLKENLPDLLVPLTRLTELSCLDLTVILHSEVPWEDLKSPLGATLEPYFIDIPPLPKEIIVQRLSFNFSPPPSSIEDTTDTRPYHPSLKPLYVHFLSVLTDVCYPFIHDPLEIAYIAAARWPGFVQPILDQHQRRWHGRNEGGEDNDRGCQSMDVDTNDIDLPPPSEDDRMRLTRLFSASLSKAMEDLYPRSTNAFHWASINKPEPDLLSKHPSYTFPNGSPSKHAQGDAAVRKANASDHDGLQSSLPRLSKFILVAAFLASTNPAKSDLRMFGRGLDEKKRKRRPRKVAPSTKNGPAKIPQRLLGPLAFPLDRLIAILGALLEDNDVDSWSDKSQFSIPGEYTDMEISRVGVYGLVMELTSMRLLHRTSHPDKIDGPPNFKCGISYETTLTLAKQLGVSLNDLMWDPV